MMMIFFEKNIAIIALLIFGLYWLFIKDKSSFFKGFWVGWLLFDGIHLFYSDFSYYYILIFSATISSIIFLNDKRTKEPLAREE